MKENVICELQDSKGTLKKGQKSEIKARKTKDYTHSLKTVKTGMTKHRGRSKNIKNIRSKKRMKKTHQNTDVGHTESGEILVIKDLQCVSAD